MTQVTYTKINATTAVKEKVPAPIQPANIIENITEQLVDNKDASLDAEKAAMLARHASELAAWQVKKDENLADRQELEDLGII